MKKLIIFIIVIALLLPLVGCAKPVSLEIQGTDVRLAAGPMHSLVIKSDGSLWAWGNTSFGEVGNGDSTKARHYKDPVATCPTPVKVLNDCVAVDGGGWHSMAITSDGSLYTWGENSSGELGTGNNYNRYWSPNKMMDDVVAISAGVWYSMAIKSDGSLWTWGYNGSGQLGRITDEKYNNPNPEKIMDDVSAISAGNDFAVAIKKDGTVWTWGGTVGHTPKKIMSRVVAISAGGDFCLAIKTDGSLWAWGSNQYGQIGNGKSGEDEYSKKPEKIMEDCAKIAAGSHSSYAIKKDGSLCTWGIPYEPYDGDVKVRIKNTDTGDYFTVKCIVTPEKIMDDCVDIAVGYMHCIAIKADNTLWAWGENSHGQLGVGDKQEETGPIFVMNLSVS